jgi:hypothetical protein
MFHVLKTAGPLPPCMSKPCVSRVCRVCVAGAPVAGLLVLRVQRCENLPLLEVGPTKLSPFVVVQALQGDEVRGGPSALSFPPVRPSRT